MSQLKIDSRVRFVLQLVASIAVLLVLLIVVFLLFESRTAISELGSRMWTDESWAPKDKADAGEFRFLPMVAGTILVALGAILIAGPLGIASAIFNQYYAPAYVSIFYRRIVELLAGIPSVVFGLWGLVVLCPMIAWAVKSLGMQAIPGPSLLAAIIVVALMILPTVMLLSESALRAVPTTHIRGAAALGMGRFATVWHVVLPQSKTGIVTGVVLAIARALGETMAVLMVAGNIHEVPTGLFDRVSTLTATIADELGYALEVQRSTLFFAGLILLGLVAVLFAVEIFLRRVVWRQA